MRNTANTDEKFSKESEILKRNQMNMLEMKNSINLIKNTA
jgi:hypothetical protein